MKKSIDRVIPHKKAAIAEKLLRRSKHEGTRLQANLDPDIALALEYLILITGASKVDVLTRLIKDAIHNTLAEHDAFVSEVETLRNNVLHAINQPKGIDLIQTSAIAERRQA